MSSTDASLEDHLYRRLQALVLAIVDMVDVAETCQYLLGSHSETASDADSLPWRVRRTLETGLFVTYARSFTASRGSAHMKRVGTLGDDLRIYHDEIVERRNKVYAHIDKSPFRRVIELEDAQDRAEWLQGPGSELKEHWYPPTREGLTSTIELAEAHLSSFLEQLGELRKRLA